VLARIGGHPAIRIDKPYLDPERKNLGRRSPSSLEAVCREAAWCGVSTWASPKTTGELAVDTLGLEAQKNRRKTKTAWSTDAGRAQKKTRGDHPVCRLCWSTVHLSQSSKRHLCWICACQPFGARNGRVPHRPSNQAVNRHVTGSQSQPIPNPSGNHPHPSREFSRRHSARPPCQEAWQLIQRRITPSIEICAFPHPLSGEDRCFAGSLPPTARTCYFVPHRPACYFEQN